MGTLQVALTELDPKTQLVNADDQAGRSETLNVPDASNYATQISVDFADRACVVVTIVGGLMFVAAGPVPDATLNSPDQIRFLFPEGVYSFEANRGAKIAGAMASVST